MQNDPSMLLLSKCMILNDSEKLYIKRPQFMQCITTYLIVLNFFANTCLIVVSISVSLSFLACLNDSSHVFQPC